MLEMAPLSEPMKANGREPVAIARTAPIVPPWAKQTTRSPAWRSAIRPIAGPHARRDGGIGLGARDHVPPLLVEHPKREGVAVGDALAVDAPVPLAEQDFRQSRFDLGHEREPCREWSGSLGGAAQARDVDGVDAGGGQAVGDEHSLLPSEL